MSTRPNERTVSSAAPVMDYPAAWEFVRATDPADHHEKCSWRQTNGALLCDCDVLWDEYERRGGIGDAGFEKAVKP